MSDQAPANTETALPKDLAAEKGLVNVQIDGAWIQVPRGTRMIEACKMAEKEVPHYCYHPKLTSPGNCRMCLVQMGMPPRLGPGQDPSYNEEGFQDIGWMPRPVIACANTVSENMGIRTTGDLVENCRKGVMEFLLINHPLDCPICDQAGECRLQEFSVDHGNGISRFRESKVKKPKNVPVGDRVRLDDERCIMCSRCIRFMDEVAEDPVLGFTQRGTHTTVTVHPGQKLNSNYSLNTVDICPVGALTSEDFRFQMRVWFLKETNTIDTNCGTGCNTTVWTRGNKIFRITPRQNDEVNSTWMPDSHRLSFDHVSADDRLTEVLLRKEDGQHQVSTWETAITQSAEALKAFSGEEIAVIGSANQTNEELYLLGRVAQSLNTSHISTVGRIGESDGKLISADRNANTTGAQLIWQITPDEQLTSIREGVQQGRIKALICSQEDLLSEAGFTEEDLEKLEYLVVTATNANGTARHANLVLPAATAFEKRGSLVNVAGRLQKLNPALLVPGDARDDWQILNTLFASISGEDGFGSLTSVFKELTSQTESFSGQTYSSIGDQGVVITQTGVHIPLIEQEATRKSSGQIVG